MGDLALLWAHDPSEGYQPSIRTYRPVLRDEKVGLCRCNFLCQPVSWPKNGVA